MIKIDFALAISIYLTLSLLLVIGYWIFYNWYRGKDIVHESQYIYQCPYCTYIFFHYNVNKEVVICPKCQSYLQINSFNGKEEKSDKK